MRATARDKTWMPEFRRSLSFLRPHRGILIIGLVAAIGVSVSYTFSISTIIPVLKVIFADHETLVDWLHRSETERRLGVTLASDVPDDDQGLRIDRVKAHSPAVGLLEDGERLVALNGERVSSFTAMAVLAEQSEDRIAATVRGLDGNTREVELPLLTYRSWWSTLQSVAACLPASRDPAGKMLTLALVLGVLVVIAIVGGICRFLNDGMVNMAVQRAMHDLRCRVGDHVLRLPLDWHSVQPPGDTLARLATDISKVEVGQTTLFGKVVREPLKAVGVLVLTLLIDWRLLLVAAVGLPIAVVVLRVLGKLVKRAQRRASQSWGRLLDHLGERLGGIRVVKAYNMQTAESARFEREGRTLTKAQTHIELVDAATNPALETLAMFAVAAFVLYGASRVFAQELEPHLFFAAVVCLGGIFDPVRKMGNVNNRLQAAEASSKRLFELIDVPREEPAAANGVPLTRLEREIEFRDVNFTYPSNPQPVLRDVNLRVSKGEVVALVGPNGSGKTTLMSLLLRFYEPTRGQILLDGQDIAAASLESLRAQIGLVTQEAVVFSGTLAENIAYGANGVSEEAMHNAARRAHVDEFARELTVEDNGQITRGYEAHISGRTLSGGQRQRVALARAILRDPPILILDEATSQVDSESERKIQDALADVTRNRTTFIIAHRFSTIAHADRIVVLNEGRIVGSGRHEELLKTCPLYVSLCQTQFAQPIPNGVA
ncbi:MAG: ABC transporter transmembrane domain-containing protein [Phycisphaerae bacterium]|jgi:ABC-type multidrug transport system fused ATPase/permease subunit